jgi:undecaprenyl-diphosphatase
VNDYLLSVILGIVEGLTEFLPVSSTAHLRIAEALLHIDLASGYWKMYTIVIQLGAILTLPIYFRHRIAKFLSTFPKGERGDRTVLTHPLSLVTIAFVVTAIPAFLMTKIIGKHLESLYIMGCALLIGGIVMWFIDARNSKAEAAGEGSKTGLIRTWSGSAPARSSRPSSRGRRGRCRPSPPDSWRVCRARRHWSFPSFCRSRR